MTDPELDPALELDTVLEQCRALIEQRFPGQEAGAAAMPSPSWLSGCR